jgi:hypothetical protein
MQYCLGIMFILFVAFACDNKPDCRQIRNGNFYYYTKGTREKVNIYRQDSLQTETDADTDILVHKNKVVWNDDCNFLLYLNAFSDTKLTGDDSIIAATPARVEIIDVKDSFYVCLAKLRIFGKEIVLRDTMYFKL